ncbi:PAS domain S-box protein [Sphingomonas sp. BN140010]|uniref:histidine kinase n=1 Tax=Sphingomonas arvum TaxID=2992113 RepID=A0ABT3JHL2_9SPHN|nr:PAS domain S-box protein [Sphingomonas sp. BN140010]MCW3798481.1 PAS domain S-box protein [Sphingomonas sp. BN140010]
MSKNHHSSGGPKGPAQQGLHELRLVTERFEVTQAELASQTRFLEATLSSIPDFVYAFDPQHRFIYANRAMLGLFGLSAEEMRGRTFADLDYPTDLAELLNSHIARVLAEGATVTGEVFYESPTGYSAYFDYVWGPVFAADGSVELVVGVSRDTSERHAFEEALSTNEARLRAATELVGLGIYSWDPVTGALDWDDQLRAMWGLPPDAGVDMAVYEAGIHPDDLARVRDAIEACVSPAGDGRYNVEYRVIGRDDGITRYIATAGRTTFQDGKPASFIGAAIDVTAQRRAEAAVRASEAQFRGFAENSSNLIWIADKVARKIVYRSAAFEQIVGAPADSAPTGLADWLELVHPDDRDQVERALTSVGKGEVAQYEYRISRLSDGAVRSLRDTSFPIRDDKGEVTQIAGIAEDLTREDANQIYILSTHETVFGNLKIVLLIGAVLLALAHQTRFSRALFANRPARLVGLWSFSIYLLHEPVMQGIGLALAGLRLPPFVVGLAGVTGTLLASAVSFSLIERPGQQVIRRLAPSGRRLRGSGAIEPVTVSVPDGMFGRQSQQVAEEPSVARG